MRYAGMNDTPRMPPPPPLPRAFEVACAAFARNPDMVILGAVSKPQLGCIMGKWAAYRAANPSQKPRLVFADMGQDYTGFAALNASAAEGIEGFSKALVTLEQLLAARLAELP